MLHKVMARGWLVGLPGGCDVIHNMQNNSNNKNKPETRAGGRGSKSPLSGRGRSGPHDGRVQIARGADSKKSLNRLKKKFLVGAFSLKEKSPTITVGTFFFFFSLTLNGPLFLQNSYLAYEVVSLNHLRNSTGPKGTPLEYFWL